MKAMLPVVALASLLGGCVVVPVGPPGRVYLQPRVVVAPPPVVYVRPWNYRHW